MVVNNYYKMSKIYEELCPDYEKEVYKRGDILVKYLEKLYSDRQTDPELEVDSAMYDLFDEMNEYIYKYSKEYERVLPGELFEHSFMNKKVLEDEYGIILDMMTW